MKDGLGEMNYSGGGFYRGRFASDKPNGRGSYRYGDGSTATGTFRNGLLHGAGSVDFPDGSAYTGALSQVWYHFPVWVVTQTPET